MQEESQTPFTSEYQLALTQYVATQDESNLQRARELGGLANSLGVLSHELVALHAAGLLACAPEGGVKQFTTAAEFLTQSLEALEQASAHQRAQVLKRAAHELRTPLTTLRLTLQVGLGRLEKGDNVDAPTLQKALSHVDKLTAKITELLSGAGNISRSSAISP